MTTPGRQPPRPRVGRLALLATCLAAAMLGYFITPDEAPEGSIGSVGAPQGSAAERADNQATAVEMSASYGDEDENSYAAWWKQLPASASALGLPDGADCLRINKWLNVRGGVDRGWSSVTVSIRARRPANIELLTVRAHILSSHPPAPSPTLLCVAQTDPFLEDESDAEYTMGAFVIDGSENSIYHYQEIDEPRQANLGFGEILHLPVIAYARVCDCSWQLEVDALVDGNRQRWLLNNAEQGAPFHTVAPPSSLADPTIEVWCAPDGHGRLTVPERGDCPLPDE